MAGAEAGVRDRDGRQRDAVPPALDPMLVHCTVFSALQDTVENSRPDAGDEETNPYFKRKKEIDVEIRGVKATTVAGAAAAIALASHDGPARSLVGGGVPARFFLAAAYRSPLCRTLPFQASTEPGLALSRGRPAPPAPLPRSAP